MPAHERIINGKMSQPQQKMQIWLVIFLFLSENISHIPLRLPCGTLILSNEPSSSFSCFIDICLELATKYFGMK